MKTYLADIIPKIQNFSKKLDNLSLLMNQHWIVVDEIENSKTVYIFRKNNDLLISKNGKVEKSRWEYLGNDYLLIETKEEGYLFKHGFFDERILALKIDSKDEYAFLVNENKSVEELNSPDKIVAFLKKNYLELTALNKENLNLNQSKTRIIPAKPIYKTKIVTKSGELEVHTHLSSGYTNGDKVFLDSKTAPDGKYVTGWPRWLEYVTVKDGKLKL